MAEWAARLDEDGFKEPPIGFAHALKAGSLSGEHRDPFDRMIAAQALIEKLPVITNDSEIAGLGAEAVW
jgi:PIN domain nuclease of toxin-antitoxin system